jgi:hypothetical protein
MLAGGGPMAQLRALMRIVEDEMRHHPQIADWRTKLREKVAAVNRAFCGDIQRKWPWMIRTHELMVYPDLELPLGVGNVVRKIGYGNRTFDIPVGLLNGEMYPEETHSLWREHHMALSDGAVVELADRSLDPQPQLSSHGNWAYAPFAIEMVVPTSGIAPAPASVTIQLDPTAEIPALLGTEGDLAIRWPRRRLPADCSSVIAVRDEHGRRLAPLSSTQLTLSESQRNRIGTPCFLVEDSGKEMRAAALAYPGVHDSTVSHPHHTPFLAQRETWPVRETISLAIIVTGGTSIKASTKHRVFLSWFWGGRFGPPSNEVTVTTTDSGNTLRVSGIRPLPTSGANMEYGRRLSVWMAEGESGAFMLKGFVTDSAATTYDIVTSNNNPNTSQLRLLRWDEHYFDGLPKYLRIYPRPAAFARYTVEYRAFPRELVEDTDAPEIDGPHEIIGWLAAAELIEQNGRDASRARAQVMRYERMLLGKASQTDKADIRFGQVAGDVGATLTSAGFASRFIDGDSLNWDES